MDCRCSLPPLLAAMAALAPSAPACAETSPADKGAPIASEGDVASEGEKTDAPPSVIEKIAVSFEGAPDGFAPKAKLISSLAAGTRRPATLAAIRRTAERDAAALTAGLQAFGFYEGAAGFRLDTENKNPSVVFLLTPGPLYRAQNHRIIYADTSEDAERPTTPDALDIALDDKADGTALAAAQQKILSALWNAGYPEARPAGRRAIARPAEGQTGAALADIEFRFRSGPKARFGALQVDGANRTKLTFLEKLKTWEEGDLFEQAKLVAYRDRLVGTNLFTSVDVAPGASGQATSEETEKTTGQAPVLITLEERKRRTIGVGGSFSTTEGPGGRLFFEYRNLFGAGESLRAEIAASEVEQSVSFDINKPMPTLPGSIFANLSYTNETPDAFTAQTIAASAGVAKQWLDGRLETRAGLAFETSNIEDDNGDERTYFIAAPLSAVWNTEDDPLSLSKGSRASLVVSPNAGSDTFVQMELNARGRRNFGPAQRYTLAARVRLGASFASSLEDLPVTKRFYAGGGSSVRGYDFQAVGPLDTDNEPIGGRSVIEGAIEARAKVKGPFQAALFIDAGSISSSAAPDFTGDYLVGVGAGLRYLSAIGPLRVDFALPLEQRAPDRAWQLYISLGQPF